jgi:transcriptional regulator with XRE-family HTH domain
MAAEERLAEEQQAVRQSSQAMTRGRRGVQAVDLEVCRRIRERRVALGLTQQQLAELVGVTYQQMHKYETGTNRLSAGRLYQIAQALGADIGHFFADVDPEGLLGGAEPPEGTRSQRRMLQGLLRHAASVGALGHRKALCQLARELAALGVNAPDDPQVEQPQPPPQGQPDPIR